MKVVTENLLLQILPFAILTLAWLVFWLIFRRRRAAAGMGSSKTGYAVIDHRWLPSGLAALAFSLVYLWSSSLVRRGVVEGILRTSAVLLPVLPLLWFLVAWARVSRRGDELERRLQLEGAGFALPAFMVFMLGSAILHRFWDLYPFADAWAFLPLFYWGGLMLAKLRYPSGGGRP